MILAQDRGKNQVVVAIGENCGVACEKLGSGSCLVNLEVVHHGLNGERDTAGETAFGVAHQDAETLLRLQFMRGIEDESHAAAGHAAEHPEAPECWAKGLADFVNQSLGVEIVCPGNDGLDGTIKVALRGVADCADLPGAQVCNDFIEDCAGLQTASPLSLRPQQVALSHHFEDGPNILRHATVHQHQAVLQLLARVESDFRLRENAVVGQQPAAADAEFGIAFGGQHSLDQFDAGPNAARVLPAAA